MLSAGHSPRHLCTCTISLGPYNSPTAPVIISSWRYCSSGKLGNLPGVTPMVRGRAGSQIQSDSRAYTFNHHSLLQRPAQRQGTIMWFPVTEYLDPGGCGVASEEDECFAVKDSAFAVRGHMSSATQGKLECTILSHSFVKPISQLLYIQLCA